VFLVEFIVNSNMKCWSPNGACVDECEDYTSVVWIDMLYRGSEATRSCEVINNHIAESSGVITYYCLQVPKFISDTFSVTDETSSYKHLLFNVVLWDKYDNLQKTWKHFDEGLV
jgi:hypothetical protein